MNTELYYNPSDTICAISTPPGVGGVAIARVSGAEAFAVVSRIWKGKDIEKMKSHTAHLGEIVDSESGRMLDQVVLTVFRAPASFTGDDVAEISMHGSRWIQREIIAMLQKSGARLALPGEFTRRAFASGKMDLAEAEAVADLIASSSAASHRLAISQMRGGFSQKINDIRQQLVELASLLELELDFSEEDVEFASREKLVNLAEQSSVMLHRLAHSFSTGAAIKDGIPVAIVGKTNVGKSSLLNAIVGDDRAIVSDIHGTTRDIVEDTVEIGPYIIRFKDTAGIRRSDDPIENLGIDRSWKAANTARIVLSVIDATTMEMPDMAGISAERMIWVINKIDKIDDVEALMQNLILPHDESRVVVPVSAKDGEGIDELKKLLLNMIENMRTNEGEDEIIVTNARHAAALEAAAAALDELVKGLNDSIPVDFVAQDLRLAIHHLSTITGAISTPEILQTIFTHFCVGK